MEHDRKLSFNKSAF